MRLEPMGDRKSCPLNDTDTEETIRPNAKRVEAV
jgi:hypothetical protein